jgi:hypothetical protein
VSPLVPWTFAELDAEAVQPFGECLSAAKVDALECTVALTLLVAGVPERTAGLGADLGPAQHLLDAARPRTRFASHTSIVRRTERERVRVSPRLPAALVRKIEAGVPMPFFASTI